MNVLADIRYDDIFSAFLASAGQGCVGDKRGLDALAPRVVEEPQGLGEVPLRMRGSASRSRRA